MKSPQAFALSEVGDDADNQLSGRAAVFLDRDGTINHEVQYLHDPAKLRLTRGAARAIRLLNEAQMLVIVVTNQSGIGRGYYSLQAMEAVHRELTRRLSDRGAHLDAIYYCPHLPTAGCECRKPRPGLLLRAAVEWGLELSRCTAVGDKVSDLEAGRRAGCRTVLVLSGHGPQALREFRGLGWQPDVVTKSLLPAVEWILTQSRLTT